MLLKTQKGQYYSNKGFEYEDVILRLLNSKKSKIYENLIQRIKKKLKIKQIREIKFEKVLQPNVINIFNQKSVSKSDIICKINNNISFGISIKNNKSGFQILNTSINSFINLLNFYKIKYDEYFLIALSKYLGLTKDFNTKKVFFNCLTNKEKKSMYKVFSNKKFKKVFLNHIWKTNSIKNKKYHSKFLIINNGSFANDNLIKPIVISLNDFVKKNIDQKIRISPNGIIHFCGISFNKKGSGSNFSKKHSIQIKQTSSIIV